MATKLKLLDSLLQEVGETLPLTAVSDIYLSGGNLTEVYRADLGPKRRLRSTEQH